MICLQLMCYIKKNVLIFILEDFDKSFQTTSTKDPGTKMYLIKSRFTVKVSLLQS